MTFAKPQLLAMIAPSLPVPMYCDPGLTVYRALGFGRMSVARATMSVRVWRAFFGLAMRGKLPSSPRGQDTLQLGGDIVIDADCRLTWHRPQEGPEDYPSFEELVAATALARAAT